MFESSINIAYNIKKNQDQEEIELEKRLNSLNSEIRRIKLQAVAENNSSVLGFDSIDKDLVYLRTDYKLVLNKLNQLRLKKRKASYKFNPNGGNKKSNLDEILIVPGSKKSTKIISNKKFMTTAKLNATFTNPELTNKIAILDMSL